MCNLNPKGIASLSPGLRGTSYPGSDIRSEPVGMADDGPLEQRKLAALDFQTCCVADFPAFASGFGAGASKRSGDGQVGRALKTEDVLKSPHHAGLEICDTADLE